MTATEYKQDNDGNIIDPPVMRDHERQIADAQATGDDNLVHALQEEYHQHRSDIVGKLQDADDPDVDPGDLAGDTNDAGSLASSNSYAELRDAARARGLDTGGGKIDLANRIAGHDDPDNSDDSNGGGDGS